MRGRTSGRAAADVKSGPIGRREIVVEGGGVVEYRGLRRVGSGLNSGDSGDRGDGGGGSGPKRRDGGGGSGKGSPYSSWLAE